MIRVKPPHLVDTLSHSVNYYLSMRNNSTSQRFLTPKAFAAEQKKRNWAVGYKFSNAVRNVLAGTAAADGCEYWVMDDGVEGYMSPHTNR